MITIKSFPLNEIDSTIAVDATLDSNEIIKNLFIDISEAPTDKFIEVTYNGVTKTLLINDECRFTPVDVFFLNKEGALQVQTFFKARKDDFNITSESYQADQEIGLHQEMTYNVGLKHKVNLSTGFITEDKNEIIKQLLCSQKIWFLENDVVIPVKVSTTSLQYKTRQNDKLINYLIDFNYAFNDINNV